MFEIYWSVSRDGRFVFRTDICTSASDAERIEAVLCEKFPASEGWAVSQCQRPAAWTHTQVN